MVGKDVIPRFVGSYEYWNALKTLERLVQESDPEQIEVYDELISVRPELSYHVGTAKAFWKSETAFDASKIVIDPQDQSSQGGTLRSGLAWLMALARMELSSTLSAYSEVEDPFEALEPTEFDRRQYEVVLFDDALTHAIALQNDPVLKDVTKKLRQADLQALDYWRRIKLVTDLTVAASKSPLNNENTSDYWKSAYKDLKKDRKILHTNISLTITKITKHAYAHEYINGTIVDTPGCARQMLNAADFAGDVKSRRIIPK